MGRKNHLEQQKRRRMKSQRPSNKIAKHKKASKKRRCQRRVAVCAAACSCHLGIVCGVCVGGLRYVSEMYDLRREKTKQRENPTTERQRKMDPLAEKKKRQLKQRRERKEEKEQGKSHAVIAHLPLFCCFARFYLLLSRTSTLTLLLFVFWCV